MRSIYHFLLGLLLCSLVSLSHADDKPQALVTIKPIQLIFAEIAGDSVEVSLLLPPGASPHIYHLKPSDIQRLSQADAIVWVSRNLETFLPRIIASIQPEHSIELAHRPELTALGEASSSPDTHHDHAPGFHDHDHVHSDSDSHIWFSPELAEAIAQVATNLFTELLPEQKSEFEGRLTTFKEQLRQTDQENLQLLAPVQKKGFVVTHDAYGRFVEHYGLNQIAAITISPDRQPGTRHIARLRSLLLEEKAKCILLEPQIPPRHLEVLTQDIQIRTQTLDPLATNIEPGKGSYALFLKDLANSLATCLQ